MKSHVAQALDAELAKRGLRVEQYATHNGVQYWIADSRDELRGGVHVIDAFGDAHPACVEAIRDLMQRYPDVVDVRRVVYSHLDEGLQGQGLGRLLYERIAEDLAEDGFALVPDNCGEYGGTSEEAFRVWRSLARDYPHEDYSYRGDKPGAHPSASGVVVFGRRSR